ncbi:MAG: hypothetical protein JO257_24440 [Deltaproteobacteria bacterium]|nr:hypothetical protein [Deltaproteobacteria bacterium]
MVAKSDANHEHISYHLTQTTPTRLIIGQNSTSAPALFMHLHGATLVPATGGTLQPLFDSSIPIAFMDADLSGNTTPIVTQNGASLTLRHVTVHDSQRLAVAGAFVAKQLSIYNNTDATAAIVVTGPYDVTIDRGQIHDAVSVLSVPSASHVHLTNLMVWNVTNRPFNLALNAGDLQFSTIAKSGGSTTTAPCILSCGSQFHVTSSIIWQPQCNGTFQDAAGPCSFQSSIVSNANAPAGTTNANPMFVDPNADFHIRPTSAARDAVDTGPAVDFEGDARPGGPKYDIGADEIP